MQAEETETHDPAARPPRRTHRAALAVVPPPEVWPAIQRIRCEHDPLCRRWMPHITLVYPFCAADAHDRLAPRLAAACRAVEPFQVLLRRFGVFRGKGDRHVIWLTPEPSDRLQALHGVVSRSLPDCVGPPPGAEGYVPHLTVGRVGGWPNARRELAGHAARWEPVAFAVDQVSILVRGAPPEDAFRVTRHIPLGGP